MLHWTHSTWEASTGGSQPQALYWVRSRSVFALGAVTGVAGTIFALLWVIAQLSLPASVLT